MCPSSRGRPPAPGSSDILVTPDLAEVVGIDVGQPLPMKVPSGTATATVSGILERNADARGPHYGLLAPLRAAWTWAGSEGVTSAYVRLDKGVDGAQWAAEHRRELGGLQPPTYGLYQSDAQVFFRQIERSIAPVATAALIIAGYLIYLTFARTVEDRRQTHATIRTLGASRSQVFASCSVKPLSSPSWAHSPVLRSARSPRPVWRWP